MVAATTLGTSGLAEEFCDVLFQESVGLSAAPAAPATSLAPCISASSACKSVHSSCLRRCMFSTSLGGTLPLERALRQLVYWRCRLSRSV
eukprot:2339725-Rhodomonas_salina.1